MNPYPFSLLNHFTMPVATKDPLERNELLVRSNAASLATPYSLAGRSRQTASTPQAKSPTARRGTLVLRPTNRSRPIGRNAPSHTPAADVKGPRHFSFPAWHRPAPRRAARAL